jgi:thymidylate synthase
MNNIDKQYQDLLQDILDNGVEKKDRTGTGTISVFGRQIRHKMSEGFPLLTTKKMPWKSIVTELLWFLQGNTNIKWLVDNGCNIWNGDAYKNYVKHNQFNSNPKWLKPIPLENGDNGAGLYSIEEFINKIKTDDEFAKKWGELGPIYGKQWRKWNSISDSDFDMRMSTYEVDQIQNLINDLKTNPDSRRLMVNAWNVGELDQMVLPPCHYGFQVYTRELTWEEQVQWVMKNTNVEWENVYIVEEVAKPSTPKRAISLSWNQRSVDVFLGLPFNIASYGLLLEIIAKVVNMVPEHLVGHLGDTHLYNNHIEQAKEQISREPFELPTLNINTEFWQTESGECGVGPLSTSGFISGLADDNFCKCLLEDIQLTNYQSHPAIKAPLSN